MSVRCLIFSLAVLSACAQPPAPVTGEDVQARYDAARQSYENEFAEFERTAQPGQAFAGNLEPLADYLRAAMRQRAGDAEARERAAIYLATLPGYQTEIAEADCRELIAAAPAASAQWALAPQDSIRYVAETLPPAEARSFLNVLLSENADETVKGWALIRLAELERREGNAEAYATAYAQLAPYRDNRDLRFAIRLINPENKVRVGAPAPAFSLTELGTDRVVSSESLRGRYYLLDFWATWCPPCIAERAVITRAQERFGGERFTVVSVSFDNTPDEAIAFRQRRWPMNWLNLYAPGSHFSEDDFGFGGDLAEAYEITWIGLPQLVLVSPEGEVLALRDRLDRNTLERTLAEYLTPN